MTDKNNSTLYLPSLCVVPIEARRDKTLTDAAKIYLGELNVLAQGYGYCWASDENLAQMKGVCLRTIKNWHKELDDGGYITRDTWRSHVMSPETGKLELKTKRKIYVTHSDSKNLSEGQKIALRCEGQNSAPRIEGQNSALIKKEPLNTKQENNNEAKPQRASPSVVASSLLKNQEIPEYLKKKLTKQYSDEQIKKALLAMKGRNFNNYCAALQSALKEDWEPKKDPEEQAEDNLQKTRSIVKLNRRDDTCWEIEKMGDSLEFIKLTDIRRDKNGLIWSSQQGKTTYFKLDGKSFWQDVICFVRENIPSVHEKIIQV